MPTATETALVAEPERRFRAFAVDRAIAWTLFALATAAAWWWFFRDDRVWVGLSLIAGTVVVVSLVFVVLLGVKGTSPGKSLMGLRVVSSDGGRPIGVGRALVRTVIVGIGSLPMFGLGLATLAWTAVEDRTRERRGWHDHVARSVVIDVRPRPVAEVEADERPRHVVNLTAMKLMPVRQPVEPVVPAPEPAPAAPQSADQSGRQPAGQPAGPPAGEQLSPPSGFETPESRRRRIDAPWGTGTEEGRGARPGEPASPQREIPEPPPPRPATARIESGPPGPTPPRPPQPRPQQPRPQQSGPQQPGPQPSTGPGSVQGATPAPPGAAATPPSGPNPGVLGSGPGRHAGPAPGQPSPGQPAPSAPPGQSAPSAPPGQRVARPRTSMTWRVSFDTGESFVVEGLGIVGRQPSPRPGEPVRHVVPLRSDDMSISKTHAQFHLAADGALVVTDRGSTNGSVLVRKGVSRELPSGRPATLVDGDRVVFGDRQMRVTREG